MDGGNENGEQHLVTLVAKDGPLDEQLDARILLPSDLLKSMLPEDRTSHHITHTAYTHRHP
jgi:hypothetical protein